MKLRILILVVFVSALSFLSGIYLSRAYYEQSVNKNSFPSSATHICASGNYCISAPLSIAGTSEEKQTKVISPTVPVGFCLHVPVLLYHHIQPLEVAKERGQVSLTVDNGIFDRQMAYLVSNGYQTITAGELVDAILTHSSLPAKSIVLTFDDGYLDNYDYAFPTLQKFHLIGNLMVPTGLLGTAFATNQYFSWDQLKSMVDSGTMYAYNHTWSHFPMAQGPVSKDQFEINTSQQELSDHLGKKSSIFVYPYGSGQTTPWVIALLKQDGFTAAFSTLYGYYQCDSNIYALPRIHVGNAPLGTYGL